MIIDINERKKKISNYRNELFKLRQEKGIKLQPSIVHQLLELANAIKPSTNSFERSQDLLTNLAKRCTFYHSCSKWLSAAIHTDSKYLYRIQSFESTVKYNEIRKRNIYRINKDDIELEGFYKESYEKIVNNFHRNNNNWQHFGNLITQWTPNRSFSWWTDSLPKTDFILENDNFFSPDQIINEWVVELAHNIGFPNDWLSEKSLILRIEVDKVKDLLFVPSAIDAFTQEVFSPVDEVTKPSAGKAIKIDKTLSTGFNEYLIPLFDISLIEFLPVRLNIKAVINTLPFASLVPPTINFQLYEELLAYHN
ncbi:hypothetical protein [Emticicia sp. 21SJ11W-3]|uniref:hypothetical protein n=1 Tax=Emticicia sp. 21SJ11W-3 TaxID=2916755 RepID=UPI00209F2FD4|nr:hypothetical protein [Emticicia sp. 21SJ11W-3]UTA66965.1 hypothetical protein MB380_15305 [Emticicia sp. 21SJ11W-3]